MSVSFNKYFTYTILSGQTNGPAFGCDLFEDMVSLIILAPAVMLETTLIQVNDKRDGSGTWRTLQNETPADIAGPAAGKARVYTYLVNAVCFRLVASGAVAADRVHQITGQWTAR